MEEEGEEEAAGVAIGAAGNNELLCDEAEAEAVDDDDEELRLSFLPMEADEETIILRRFEVRVSPDTNEELDDEQVEL